MLACANQKGNPFGHLVMVMDGQSLNLKEEMA